jgi:hypothetical protein
VSFLARHPLFGIVVAMAALSAPLACGVASEDDASESEEAIEEGRERRAVGRAQPYPADRLTEEDEKRLRTSIKARRELGWKILAKAIEPAKIAQQEVVGLPPGEKTIPLFRTWLGSNEIDLMFAKMFTDLGKERRVARDAPSDQEWDALLEHNATNIYPFSETEFFDRLKKIGSKEDLDGLGGNQRTAYSPGYAKHLIQDYAAVVGCTETLKNLSLTTPPRSATNFTNCFSREMPADAVAIKTSWRRTDEMGMGLSIADTSAATMKKRLSGELDDGDWKIGTAPKKKVGPDKAYTIRFPDESLHALAALHLMTKELRHWVWVTVWWSDTPNEDFGADRPATLAARFGPAWANYKMCVVTDFDEADPDPRGGFEGTLGDALEAVRGKSTWCSNPYIEKGAKNAQTNCIGCHQHAGHGAIHDLILADETRFPASGRTNLRTAFPFDYSWAIAAPPPREGFLDQMRRRIEPFDAEDR